MLTEELIKKYYLDHNLPLPNLYCKDCGKLLIYDNADIKFQKRKGKYKDTKAGDIVSVGHTFLSTLQFGKSIFHLCRCKECVEKVFPGIASIKFLYAQKAAKYTQYAYDVPDDIFKEYTKQRQAITKERMITLWGDIEGKKRWDAYCQKEAITNTFEYKQEKYGMTLLEFNNYNKSRACTIETFKKRYGDEWEDKWNSYCERQRYTTSLEYFIETYGITVGYEKYINFDNSRIQFGGASKKANSFFNKLCSNEFFNGHTVYYDALNTEYCVGPYRIDFYDETINAVIEFYGDIWHANPSIYIDPNGSIKVFQTCKVKDIWEHDKIRLNYIIDKIHCDFIIIWESDVDNNMESQINKIIACLSKKDKQPANLKI